MSDALFPHDKSNRPKPPRDAPLAAAVQHLLVRVYRPLYRQRFGEWPHNVGGRECGILKRLAQTYTAAVVERRLRLYLASNDAFATRAGHTLVEFDRQWERLRALDPAAPGASIPEGCTCTPPCPTAAAHTQKTIAAIRTMRSAGAG